MFSKRDFCQTIDLFAHGALEVLTFAKDEEGNKGTLAFRSLVQPDADIITFAAEDAIAKQNLIRLHIQNLKNRLRFIKYIRKMFSIAWIVSPPILVITFLEYDRIPFCYLVLLLIAALSAILIKPVLTFMIKRKVKKQLAKYSVSIDLFGDLVE